MRRCYLCGRNWAIEKNMLRLHRKYQTIFEQTHTREQFMAEFGKNYLDD